MKETLAQVSAPHFTAGLVLWNDKVEEAAPVLRYMRRWPRARVRAYCQSKGWAVCVVHELQRGK